jgi:phosphoglycolate phosphatase
MSLLLIDLDNTLYNWVDYFGNSFRGMIHALSREMNLDEDELKAAFKVIYKEAGTLEYSFIIQKLPFIENYSHEEKNKIIDFGKKIFSIVRSKNLFPYTGVKETLKNLSSDGVLIVAVTNAPAYFAEARLKQLYLDHYIYGLAAWENSEIPVDEYTDEIIKKNEDGFYQSKHIKHRWHFSKDELKPNPFAYLRVINDLKLSHKNTYVIGDSIYKDLNPAKEIGATTIWAKYGTNYEEKNFNTLLEMTHWDEKKIKDTYDEKKIIPDFTIDKFDSLLDIVPRNQLKLF